MENNPSLNDSARTLAMLDRIEEDPDITQLSLADSLGVAVGTVNWYLKRLVEKGYVKVMRAQRKKLRYILTPEGLSLRARLTFNYIQTSFDLYRLVRERTAACIGELRARGYACLRLELSEGDVTEVCRLSCIEQGITICEDPTAPLLHIDGLKLSLIFPEDACKPASSSSHQENRGD